jgi:uncharacterized protein
MTYAYDLEILPGDYAVSHLPAGLALPAWVEGPGYVSVTYARDAVVVLCLGTRVPETVAASRDWVAIRLAPPLAPDAATRLLADLASRAPEADGLFITAPHHHDHILLRRGDLTRATRLLQDFGHRFL